MTASPAVGRRRDYSAKVEDVQLPTGEGDDLAAVSADHADVIEF
ncbi:hypothetical protein [Salinibacterium xinjiangense]|nr:hypothetical protein [Salinibacterium xinjiangense]